MTQNEPFGAIGAKNKLSITGDAYDQFANAIKTRHTRNLYDIGLKNFMIFKHVENVSSLLAWHTRDIEANIMSWIVHLKNDEKLSSTTIKCYLASILFFYRMNDIELRRWKIAMYLPEDRKVNDEDRGYTHEEIAKLLQYCDNRTKALVLLLASSGMRIGAVTELKMNHLTKIDKYSLYKVKVYAGFKETHITFTTPEAAAAMADYFAFRERYGERISQDSPVIREQFDIDDIIAVKHPKKTITKTLGDLIRVNLLKAGVFERKYMMEGQKKGQTRNVVPRAHGFRKFFETNLFRARIQDPIPEMLLGHDIGLKKHYLRIGEDEILEEYVKAVDILTINEENRLRRQVIQLTSQADRLDSLQAQIEAISDRLK
jgi:integrase